MDGEGGADAHDGAHLAPAGLHLANHESPLIKHETLGYLTLADGGRLRAVCKELWPAILEHKWQDMLTKVKGENVDSWRRCFPRAEGVFVCDSALPLSKRGLLAGVKKLEVHRCEMNGDVETLLEHLHGVQELSIGSCNDLVDNPVRVTDDALVHVQGLKKLTMFRLDCHGVSDSGWALLKGVKELDLAYIKLPVSDAQELLVNFTNLKAVNLDGIKGSDGYPLDITDEALSCLRAATTVKLVQCETAGVTNVGWAHLRSAQVLLVSFCSVTVSFESLLAGLPHLVDVCFWFCNNEQIEGQWTDIALADAALVLTDAALAYLKGVPKVDLLAFKAQAVTALGWSCLSSAVSLCLNDSTLGVGLAAVLTALTTGDTEGSPLKRLDITFCKQEDTLPLPVTKEALSLMRGLTYLRMNGCNISAVTGAGLAHIQGLQLLSLGRCTLPARQTAAAFLSHFTGLWNLELVDCKAAGGSPLCITDTALGHLHGIRKLDLKMCDISRVTVAGWAHLAGIKELLLQEDQRDVALAARHAQARISSAVVYEENEEESDSGSDQNEEEEEEEDV